MVEQIKEDMLIFGKDLKQLSINVFCDIMTGCFSGNGAQEVEGCFFDGNFFNIFAFGAVHGCIADTFGIREIAQIIELFGKTNEAVGVLSGRGRVGKAEQGLSSFGKFAFGGKHTDMRKLLVKTGMCRRRVK